MFGLWGNNVNREKSKTVKIDVSFRGSSYDSFFFFDSRACLMVLHGLVKTSKI